MIILFRFKKLALFLFGLFIFWSQASIDQALSGESERFPLHRLLMLVTLVISILNYQSVFSLCKKNIILLVLMVYVLTTAAWAGDSVLVFKGFIFLLVSYFTAINVSEAYSLPNDDINLAKGLYWTFLSLAVLSFIAAKFYPQYGLLHVQSYGYLSKGDLYLNNRWIGVTSHPNRLGEVGMLLVWVSTYLFFVNQKISGKLLMVFSIFLGILITRRADSMTSFVCALGAVALIVYYRYRNRINPVILVLCAVLSIFIFMIFAVLGDVGSATETGFSLLGRSSNFSGRTIQWQIVVKEFMSSFKNIAVGVGFDDLSNLTKKYKINMTQVHNGYLEVLLKGGTIGTILFLLVGYKTYSALRLLKKINYQKFIFLNSAFLVLLIHNMTETSFMKGISSVNILLFFIVIYSGIPNVLKADSMQKAVQPLIKNKRLKPTTL